MEKLKYAAALQHTHRSLTLFLQTTVLHFKKCNSNITITSFFKYGATVTTYRAPDFFTIPQFSRNLGNNSDLKKTEYVM